MVNGNEAQTTESVHNSVAEINDSFGYSNQQ